MITNLTFHNSRRLCALLSILLLAISGAARMEAQGATATILGTVTDSTGAAVPDAAVQVRNVGTDAGQTVTSDAQGRYRVPDLNVGQYEVRGTKMGFQTVVHSGIELTVGVQAVVDLSLQVGQQQQTVTVESQVSQVETTNGAVGSLIDQQQMRELPLNGRNFEQLILLAPGVQVLSSGSLLAKQGKENSFSAAGARPDNQAFLLDDEDIQNFNRRGIGTVTGTSLGVEATAEFQTLTDTYGAQFGGNGVVINAVTKSGTNSFHGSAYEFLRNSAMDARNFFDPSTVPPFRKNQFGGTAGGPIKKDKMFFFANYEGIRQALGTTTISTVPDASHRSPLTLLNGQATPASNSATAQAIVSALALYPLPTFNFNPTAGTGQVASEGTQVAHENYLLGRFDDTFSEKDSLFLRFFLDKQSLFNPFGGGPGSSPLPFWGESDQGADYFSTLQWRRIISPAIVNVARVSFSRTNTPTVPTPAETTPALQFFPGSGRPDGTVAITGLSAIGLNSFVPADQVQNRFTESEDLLWTHGAHSMRFGASVVRMDSNIYYPYRSGGAWTFSSLTNFLSGSALTFIGTPVGPQYYPTRDYRETDFAVYFQDDWKVTPKLSVNLGLRYEPTTNATDANNQLYAITDFVAGTRFVNVPNVQKNNPSLWNLDPRFGFAYDVFGDHKTAIRGGFGINHSPIFPANYNSAYSTAPPWISLQENNIAYPSVSALTASLPTQSPGYYWYTNRTPYIIQYNLNVQREISQGTVLSVGYVGSHGVSLFTEQDLNPPIPSIDSNGVYHFASLQTVSGTLKLVTNPRVDPALSTLASDIEGTTSRYNALQVSVNRRFTRNFQAQLAYTFSRCLDDGGLFIASTNGTGSATTYENPYNREYDRGPCVFNVAQTLRVNGLFALPFHGNRLVEGWQLSGILSANTGLPFTVSTGFDQVGEQGGDTPRPNYVSGCNPQVGRPNEWFNPACYSLEAPGTLGNVGRNTLVGPNLVDVDLALLKDTKIREWLNLQFRAELFNIFNHANFNLPSAGVFAAGAVAGTASPNATAGQITSTVTTSRQFQLALKFIF